MSSRCGLVCPFYSYSSKIEEARGKERERERESWASNWRAVVSKLCPEETRECVSVKSRQNRLVGYHARWCWLQNEAEMCGKRTPIHHEDVDLKVGIVTKNAITRPRLTIFVCTPPPPPPKSGHGGQILMQLTAGLFRLKRLREIF